MGAASRFRKMSSGGNRPINSSKECEILPGATVEIKARVVTVKGKRGSLTRDFKHLNVEIYQSKNAKTGKPVIVVEKWFGSKKELAAVRSLRSVHQEGVALHLLDVVEAGPM